MSNPADIVKSIAHQHQASWSTQERPLKLKEGGESLHIGIPKVKSDDECRIPLTPEAVNVLTSRGNKVWIEAGAGERAKFKDNDYSEAGAKIVYDHKEIYDAHILIKMEPIKEEELEYLRAGQFILSPIHLPKMESKILFGLLNKKVIALAFEYIKDEVKNYPIVHALSEIAGRASVLLAGNIMNNQSPGGNGILLGGVTGVRPAKVIILGAGTVGESAARAAFGLGAQVKIFDNNIYKLRRLQNNLSQRLYTSILNPEVVEAELKTADLVIGAIHSKIARTPIIVTEKMVQQMPEGAVIIDVSIDQGGIFETSEVTTIKEPTFEKHGVVHYCVPNISSMYPVTSSRAISNILLPMILSACDQGGFENDLQNHKGLRKGVYTYKGKLTNEYLSYRFQHKYTDFELLMATGFGG